MKKIPSREPEEEMNSSTQIKQEYLAGTPGSADSGMVLVQKQLNDLLAENGLEPIEAEGNKFDPNLHEAIAHEQSVSPEGTVVRQARRGYRLKDRLLRPARVVVSSGPAKK